MKSKAKWAIVLGSGLLVFCFLTTADPFYTMMRPTIPESWPSGIFEDISPPFPSESVKIENMWQRSIAGELVQVYAGSLGHDSEQGIVIVVTAIDHEGVKGERVLSKERNGALKIVEEKDGRLILESEKGVRYEFDVVSNKLFKIRAQSKKEHF